MNGDKKSSCTGYDGGKESDYNDAADCNSHDTEFDIGSGRAELSVKLGRAKYNCKGSDRAWQRRCDRGSKSTARAKPCASPRCRAPATITFTSIASRTRRRPISPPWRKKSATGISASAAMASSSSAHRKKRTHACACSM